MAQMIADEASAVVGISARALAVPNQSKYNRHLGPAYGALWFKLLPLLLAWSPVAYSQ